MLLSQMICTLAFHFHSFCGNLKHFGIARMVDESQKNGNGLGDRGRKKAVGGLVFAWTSNHICVDCKFDWKMCRISFTHACHNCHTISHNYYFITLLLLLFFFRSPAFNSPLSACKCMCSNARCNNSTASISYLAHICVVCTNYEVVHA